MKTKTMVMIVIVVMAVSVSWAFMTALNSQQSFQLANETRIGEGQKFVDASGKRCLLSDTIAGDKCPSTSKGITSDGKYDTGISGMTDIYAKEYGLNDPYDRNSMNRFDVTMGIKTGENTIPKDEDVFDPEVEDYSWLESYRGHLKEDILSKDCDGIKRFYIGIEEHVAAQPDSPDWQIQMFNQGIREYKEAYQKICEQ